MRLASPESVVTSLGVATNPGSLANAERALDSVTPLVEDTLESLLSEATVTDYFTPLSGSRVFLLSRILVGIDSVTARESLTESPLLTYTDGVEIDPSLYFLDAGKGLITFRSALNTAAHSLLVTYSAGLSVDTDTGVAQDCPAWLSEAAVAAAVYSLNVLPSAQANRKEKNVTSAAKALSSFVYARLSQHFRPRMGVEFSVRSAVDE